MQEALLWQKRDKAKKKELCYLHNEPPCYQECSLLAKPMLTYWTIIEFTNYIYSSNTSLAEKRQKKKRFMLLAKLDSMTNPSVVKIVPHWPNLMGQIREQTFTTLYATPLPYCYVLAAVTEALESISFFVMCGIWQYRLWSAQGRDRKVERFLAKNQL